MVAVALATVRYTHTFEADLRHCGSDTRMKWLQPAVRNAGPQRRILAASIAAVGTGSEFFKAYRAEVEDRLGPADQDRWRRHLLNPIGLQRVEAIVDIARRCRFRIERAQQVYKPKEFDSTDDYVRDVRAYGEEVLMAPLLCVSREDREQVWKGIARRFKELHQAKFNQGRYLHNQFVIYLLAVRHD
ncbi:MAG: hypothetical protein ACRD15_08515 [Vicinamibacterales bacterium]